MKRDRCLFFYTSKSRLKSCVKRKLIFFFFKEKKKKKELNINLGRRFYKLSPSCLRLNSKKTKKKKKNNLSTPQVMLPFKKKQTKFFFLCHVFSFYRNSVKKKTNHSKLSLFLLN